MTLIDASKKGDLDKVRRLIREGCDVDKIEDNEWGYTALIWASQEGYLDVVQCLVEEGQANVAKNAIWNGSIGFEIVIRERDV